MGYVVKLKRVDRTVQIRRTTRNIILRHVGRRGPAGPGGADADYRQTFNFVSSVTVNHGLNKYPSVTIVNTAGDEVKAAVKYINANQLIVSFSAENSGNIYCN